jgi:hypothetical protein
MMRFGRPVRLPAIVFGTIVIGWLCLQGQLRGLYDWPFGLALMVLSNVVLLTALTWRVGLSLERSEHSLEGALEEIRDLNRNLERRVEERTREVVLAKEEDRPLKAGFGQGDR